MGTKLTQPDYSGALGMEVEAVLECWRREGAPLIHLGPGQNCSDLAKLLSSPDVASDHLAAIRAWLERQK